MFQKILIMFLFSNISSVDGSKNRSIPAIKKYYDFCMEKELTTSIDIFKGLYWLPSGFSLNTSRSLKEGKLIYSNYVIAQKAGVNCKQSITRTSEIDQVNYLK